MDSQAKIQGFVEICVKDKEMTSKYKLEIGLLDEMSILDQNF